MNWQDIGIGIDDLYRNEDGDLRLKPDICSYSKPKDIEDCQCCLWFDGYLGECQNPELKEGK